MNFNQSHYSDFFNKKPDEESKKFINDNSHKNNNTFLLVDTRDRNTTTHPNTNNFIIDLDEPISDISEI